jgi:5'-AMP-activated protein kinase regulatory beta subunit
MSRSTKDFVATVDLPEGAHEYKFVVDGQWTNDPNSKDTVEREGTTNNVIRVRKEDFNAFDALDMDSEDVLKAAANSNGKAGEASNSKAEMARRLLQSGENEFGQEMPTNSFQEFRSGPPILPPHLLQVILNKVRSQNKSNSAQFKVDLRTLESNSKCF